MWLLFVQVVVIVMIGVPLQAGGCRRVLSPSLLCFAGCRAASITHPLTSLLISRARLSDVWMNFDFTAV